MEIYTIGFTKKTAANFFELLKRESIEQLVDVRLNNVSQLAGFSKREDLRYFLKTICNAEYRHEPMLAPTQEMLDDYKKLKAGWASYEARFLALMKERQIENFAKPIFHQKRSVLLCSEETAQHCHRRLVVDYLESKWGWFQTRHL